MARCEGARPPPPAVWSRTSSRSRGSYVYVAIVVLPDGGRTVLSRPRASHVERYPGWTVRRPVGIARVRAAGAVGGRPVGVVEGRRQGRVEADLDRVPDHR